MKRESKKQKNQSKPTVRSRELRLDEMEWVTGGDMYLQADRGSNGGGG